MVVENWLNELRKANSTIWLVNSILLIPLFIYMPLLIFIPEMMCWGISATMENLVE